LAKYLFKIKKANGLEQTPSPGGNKTFFIKSLEVEVEKWLWQWQRLWQESRISTGWPKTMLNFLSAASHGDPKTNFALALGQKWA